MVVMGRGGDGAVSGVVVMRAHVMENTGEGVAVVAAMAELYAVVVATAEVVMAEVLMVEVGSMGGDARGADMVDTRLLRLIDLRE